MKLCGRVQNTLKGEKLCTRYRLKTKTMKAEFKIFKEGVTNAMVTIVSKIGEDFNLEAKISKYLLLGYQVFEMDNTEIN
jgi:hypothetical protein